MRGAVTRAALLASLAGSCLGGNGATSAVPLERIGYVQARSSAEVRGSPWAIETGSLRDDVLGLAADIGVKWVRVSANWPSIERVRGEYDWTETDRAFDTALRKGITPYVTLKGGNRLYCPVSQPIGKADADELFGERIAPPTVNSAAMEAWLKFVRATVAHFRGRIRHWEVWNEPNNAGYWGASPSAEDYGRLLRDTAAAIRDTDAAAKVIAGATAGLVPTFTQGYLAAGVRKGHVDIITFHSYGESPEERYPKALRVWPLVREFDSRIQLWQGECAYPSHSSTRGWRGDGPWGLNIQAKWLLRQAFTDVFLCGATVSTYGKLFSDGRREEAQPRSSLTAIDEVLGYYPAARGGSSRVRGTGVNEKCLLENPSLAPKPAFHAYRNLCAIHDDRYQVARELRATVRVTAPGPFHGIEHDDAFPSVPLVATFATATRQPFVAYWLPWRPQEHLPAHGRVEVRLSGTEIRNPVLVDLLDGAVYRVPPVRAAEGGVVFTALPLADYPFVIAEAAEIGISAAPVRGTVGDAASEP